jgi:hypothetical protein
LPTASRCGCTGTIAVAAPTSLLKIATTHFPDVKERGKVMLMLRICNGEAAMSGGLVQGNQTLQGICPAAGSGTAKATPQATGRCGCGEHVSKAGDTLSSITAAICGPQCDKASFVSGLAVCNLGLLGQLMAAGNPRSAALSPGIVLQLPCLKSSALDVIHSNYSSQGWGPSAAPGSANTNARKLLQTCTVSFASSSAAVTRVDVPNLARCPLHGDGCSVPDALKSILQYQPESQPCCNSHDFCYSCYHRVLAWWSEIYKSWFGRPWTMSDLDARRNCDHLFKSNLKAMCQSRYHIDSWWDWGDKWHQFWSAKKQRTGCTHFCTARRRALLERSGETLAQTNTSNWAPFHSVSIGDKPSVADESG